MRPQAILVVRKRPRAARRNDKPMTAATHPHIDAHDNSLAGARAWFGQHGLTRPREGRVLAGVAAGFARRYDINPLVARVLATASILLLSPLVYIGAWILMPGDAGAAPAATSRAAA
jgi:phage shock protein PspC (stress-responsive transcriptional regulator)